MELLLSGFLALALAVLVVVVTMVFFPWRRNQPCSKVADSVTSGKGQDTVLPSSSSACDPVALPSANSSWTQSSVSRIFSDISDQPLGSSTADVSPCKSAVNAAQENVEELVAEPNKEQSSIKESALQQRDAGQGIPYQPAPPAVEEPTNHASNPEQMQAEATGASVQEADSYEEQQRRLATVLKDLLAGSSNSVEVFLESGGLVFLKGALMKLQQAAVEGSLDTTSGAFGVQATWVLLQVAHGSLAWKQQLVQHLPVQQVVSFMFAISSPGVPHSIQSAVLRNCCWLLGTLCDIYWLLASKSSTGNSALLAAPNAASSSSAGSALPSTSAEQIQLALGCSKAVTEPNNLSFLLSLLKMQHGRDTALFAAALLASVALVEDQDPDLATTARRALLQADALQLLCHLLEDRRHEHEHSQNILCAFCHNMLSRHPRSFIKQLLAEHAVAEFLEVAPKQLSALLMTQLLSTRGQRLMDSVESQHCLRVPLALAQVIPAEHHQLVPCTLIQGNAAGQAQGGEDGSSSHGHSVSTLSLACRSLLTGTRLQVLVSALFSDLRDIRESYLSFASCSRQDSGSMALGASLSEAGSAGGSMMRSSSGGRRRAAVEIETLETGCSINGGSLIAGPHQGDQPQQGPDLPPGCLVGQRVPEHLLTDVVVFTGNLLAYLVSIDVELSQFQQLKGPVADDSDCSSAGGEDDTYYMETVVNLSVGNGNSSRTAGQHHAPFRPGQVETSGRGANEEKTGGSNSSWSGTYFKLEATSAPSFRRTTQPNVDSQMPLSDRVFADYTTGSCSGDSCAGLPPDGIVSFQFGSYVVTIPVSSFRAVRRLSTLIHGWLSRKRGHVGNGPITLLHVPGLTDFQNYNMFQQLVSWATKNELLPDTSVEGALTLWKASDYLQVDELQAHCEDFLSSRLKDPGAFDAVLDMVHQNPVSAGRLHHLCIMHVFNHLASLVRNADVVSILLRHQEQLQPQLVSLVRDRLVSLVTLSEELTHET